MADLTPPKSKGQEWGNGWPQGVAMDAFLKRNAALLAGQAAIRAATGQEGGGV